ncbi:MAG: FAD-dependent oxidoreductase [Oscillospiraceae bacterium]
MAKKEISRRKFLKGAAAGTAGVAAASVLGVSAFAEPDAVSSASVTSETEFGQDVVRVMDGEGITQITNTLYSTGTWRLKQEPVAESAITSEETADVLILGNGYSGAACALWLAEQGYKVIVLENQAEGSFSLFGGDQAVINSKYIQEHYGAPQIDPLEFYHNWMLNTNNYCNQALCMKFAQFSGDSFDWHLGHVPDDVVNSMFGAPSYWDMEKKSMREGMLDKIGDLRFYAPTLRPSQATVAKYHREYIENESGTGSRHIFGCHAEYLEQDADGTVVGAVARMNDTGNYIRVRAQYTVIATGGFGGNMEMVQDLLPDLLYFMQDHDALHAQQTDRDGSGIAMAIQAGAKLEQGPIPTMDGRLTWLNGGPGQGGSPGHPQGVWFDGYGKRFQNEFWGTIEHRGFPSLFMNRDTIYCLYDNDLPERLRHVAPAHGSTDPTEGNISSWKSKLEAAYAAKGEVYNAGSGIYLYAGDTVEECCRYAGMSERVKENILSSLAQYNEYAHAGRDEEFGRAPEVLFPVENGPFFLQVVQENALIANYMVTMGGLYVDGEQRVLGEEFLPIRGLFATGNTTGGRFGRDYFTPTNGVSIGMAVCLGRECGKSVQRQLEGSIWYREEADRPSYIDTSAFASASGEASGGPS